MPTNLIVAAIVLYFLGQQKKPASEPDVEGKKSPTGEAGSLDATSASTSGKVTTSGALPSATSGKLRELVARGVV